MRGAARGTASANQSYAQAGRTRRVWASQLGTWVVLVVHQLQTPSGAGQASICALPRRMVRRTAGSALTNSGTRAPCAVPAGWKCLFCPARAVGLIRPPQRCANGVPRNLQRPDLLHLQPPLRARPASHPRRRRACRAPPMGWWSQGGLVGHTRRARRPIRGVCVTRHGTPCATVRARLCPARPP